MPSNACATVTLIDGHASVEFPPAYNATYDFVDKHLDAGDGERLAFIDAAGEYSYAELATRVNRAGNALRDAGLAAESRVLMCVLDGIDFPAAFYGAIKAGIVPVPVNTLLRSADYATMLEDSRARALLVSAELLEQITPALESARHLEHIFVCGAKPGALAPGQRDFHGAMAAASEHLEPAPTTCDDIAFWLYTSGSTGTPKGAMHLHRDLVTTAALYGQGVLGIKADDRVFSAAKLFFAYGLGNGMSFPLYVGASAALYPGRPTPQAVIDTLRDHDVSVFYGVPTLYGAILADEQLGRASVSDKLRVCVSAGEALPAAVSESWERRFGCEILDGLGSTEMLHIFLSNRPGDVRHGTSGVAVPGYELRMLAEDGQPAAAGEVGELWVNGGSSACAYWNKRARSLDTFHGPWTRTGDKYTRDADGYYVYAGRTDDMLKVSGQWVSPFEVESALLADQRVLEAAVVGAADEHGLTKPKAFVVTRDGVTADDTLADALRDVVKRSLAPFKYPRWIEFRDDLPKTATGKIQRYKLRD